MTPDIEAALLAHSPAVMVPKFSPMPEPQNTAGHRYLVATDGVYLHVYRPWLQVIKRIAPSSLRMPFGTLEEKIQFNMPSIPKAMMERFLQEARDALPNETVGLIIWDERDGQFHYQVPQILEASRARVSYARPDLEEGQWLVLDMHTHGWYPSGFSTIDNEDDASEVKISLVIGSMQQPKPDIRVRLCANGAYLDLDPHGLAEKFSLTVRNQSNPELEQGEGLAWA